MLQIITGVEKQLKNREAFFEYLAVHSKWEKVLQTSYKDKWEQAQENAINACEKFFELLEETQNPNQKDIANYPLLEKLLTGYNKAFKTKRLEILPFYSGKEFLPLARARITEDFIKEQNLESLLP
ncbi:hypothetical protein [Candidatus Neptunochlamydia vexilliferae]|uniref:Uncharacterized protein n=1 Tax=Candidatus Neptunichlamydia vexilliferae TaxID=1651774 RepID=A0ABS0AYA6_9BACT|nr:hypothetical protein [Candidatus Neptunochlamydia vexilliferae]MBF5059116.1 hypothetical protein [Candidatus Neptunochlamydia vexilliferae]